VKLDEEKHEAPENGPPTDDLESLKKENENWKQIAKDIEHANHGLEKENQNLRLQLETADKWKDQRLELQKEYDSKVQSHENPDWREGYFDGLRSSLIQLEMMDEKLSVSRAIIKELLRARDTQMGKVNWNVLNALLSAHEEL